MNAHIPPFCPWPPPSFIRPGTLEAVCGNYIVLYCWGYNYCSERSIWFDMVKKNSLSNTWRKWTSRHNSFTQPNMSRIIKKKYLYSITDREPSINAILLYKRTCCWFFDSAIKPRVEIHYKQSEKNCLAALTLKLNRVVVLYTLTST